MIRRTIYKACNLQTARGFVRYIHEKKLSAQSNVKRNEVVSPIVHDERSQVLYHNPRRLESVGLTMLAGGQVTFWSYATVVSTHTPDPVLGTVWSASGLGLSALFVLLITTYLRRLVAHVHLINGPVIRVTTHRLGGMLGKSFDVPALRIVSGGKTDSRHLTFGIKTRNEKTLYYHVDMKSGIKDRVGLAAIADGGDHVVKWAQKRDAESMQRRWREWYSGLTSRCDAPLKTSACT